MLDLKISIIKARENRALLHEISRPDMRLADIPSDPSGNRTDHTTLEFRFGSDPKIARRQSEYSQRENDYGKCISTNRSLSQGTHQGAPTAR